MIHEGAATGRGRAPNAGLHTAVTVLPVSPRDFYHGLLGHTSTARAAVCPPLALAN